MPTMLRAASLAAAESGPVAKTTQAPMSRDCQSLPARSAPARMCRTAYSYASRV